MKRCIAILLCLLGAAFANAQNSNQYDAYAEKYIATKTYCERIVYLKKLIKLSPSDSLLMELGNNYRFLNDYKVVKAIGLKGLATKDSTYDHVFLDYYLSSLRLTGRSYKVVRIFKRSVTDSVKIQGRSMPYINALSEGEKVEKELKEIHETLCSIKHFKQLKPEQITAFAFDLFKLGKVAKAKRICKKGLFHFPKYSNINFALGLISLSTGKYCKANIHFLKAAETDVYTKNFVYFSSELMCVHKSSCKD